MKEDKKDREPIKESASKTRGRPRGAKNKVQLITKQKIVKYIEENFDSFIEDINTLEPKDKVKVQIDLIKLVVPRPLADEEKDALSTQSTLFQRLTGK